MADTPEEKSIGAMIDELEGVLDKDAAEDGDSLPPKQSLDDDGDEDGDDGDDDGDDEDGDDEDGDDDGDEDEDGDDDDGEKGEEDEEEAPKKPSPKRKPKKPIVVAEDDDEDDDEDDELPTDVMGRLDYLQTHHPEVIFPDSAEMQATLASYTRDEDPVKRKSRPILSKYEATSIVGMRSQQIVQGSAPLVDVPTDDPIEVAQAELKAKIIPVVIRRILPDGTPEYWRLSELRYYG